MTENLDLRDPIMKTGTQIILCVLAVWLKTHPCIKSNVRETWACAFPLLVLQVLPIYLQCLHVLYDTLTYTLHVYKPTVWSVAGCSLFLDVQVVTLLLGEFALSAHSDIYYPTTRQIQYFSTIFTAHLRVYTRMLGCKRIFI